jgi:hypothetical protein
LLPPHWSGDLAFEIYTGYYTLLHTFLEKEEHLLDFFACN